MSTPVFSYVLRLDFMCCVKMVSELFNRPVVGLFGTRMSGKSTEMITINIYLELPPTQDVSGFSVMTGIWEPMLKSRLFIINR